MITKKGKIQDYKYLGISQAPNIKHDEMKEKVRKEYAAPVRKILQSKLNGGKTVTAINTWAVALLRYTNAIVKWTKDELLTMDRQARKLLTMHGALHPKAHVQYTRLSQHRIHCATGSTQCVAVSS